MTYILPVLYVIVSYTFFLLAVCFGNAITLQIVSILLPFIMGIVNLIVVLTAGRKWSRKSRQGVVSVSKSRVKKADRDRTASR